MGKVYIKDKNGDEKEFNLTDLEEAQILAIQELTKALNLLRTQVVR